MKSKFAYGKSDSAVYLAEYLMKKGNQYEIRKVSAKLVMFNRQVKEIAGSNLSPQLKVWTLNMYQKDFTVIDQRFTDDDLIYNLMHNVSRGKVRELFRSLKEEDPIGYNRVIPDLYEYVNKNPY
jgi:hypothetical protein